MPMPLGKEYIFSKTSSYSRLHWRRRWINGLDYSIEGTSRELLRKSLHHLLTDIGENINYRFATAEVDTVPHCSVKIDGTPVPSEG